jgi:NAD+ synthase (glutamine-hydrolysing)
MMIKFKNMAKKLRIGLAQINPTVGDLEGNLRKHLFFLEEALHKKVDLLCFPELSLTGYPPEDLLLKPSFIRHTLQTLKEFAQYTKGKDITIVLGSIDFNEGIYNTAWVINKGEIKGVYHKVFLSNYGGFEEERYFKEGDLCPLFLIKGIKVGISIGEDLYYPIGPVTTQILNGAELIVNIDASPYYIGKKEFREKIFFARAQEGKVPIAYINMVGGQDELVFDGNSFVFDEKGEVIIRGKPFEEELTVIDLVIKEISTGKLLDPWLKKNKIRETLNLVKSDLIVVDEDKASYPKPPIEPMQYSPLSLLEEVYQALLTGTRDYVKKNGFEKVLIGLSGGIDSSLVATVAVDALGKENVIGVMMPSRYTSQRSLEDASQLARNLGIELKVIPIEPIYKAYLDTLSPHFKGTEFGTAEENIQARIRGNLLMALSNKFGWLVLTTGNKSEMACGYATLYGDMAGGFAVIKDVPKTMVYELVKWRNKVAGYDLIPRSVIEKPPSAELKPDQKDTDVLPPYDILDPILKLYVEENASLEEIVSLGFDEETVKRVIQMVDKNEYKRRQAPPGIRITQRSFGRDWRLPITNKYRNGL